MTHIIYKVDVSYSSYGRQRRKRGSERGAVIHYKTPGANERGVSSKVEVKRDFFKLEAGYILTFFLQLWPWFVNLFLP